MKRKRILALADFIEAGTHPWGIDDCSTCFMGQLEAQTAKRKGAARYHGCSMSKFFGVENVGDLIMPSGFASKPDLYPRSAAVAVLRNLAETGEVDWDKARATNPLAA